MTRITEAEFTRIVDGIREDRDSIIKHNPMGSDEEILLWMLLAVLSSYLNLSEQETPCFTGRPNADTYREAIRFVIDMRHDGNFDVDAVLDTI
ncbi:MAG: hypothetical protein ACJ73D_11215 [Pyrinomonadaceae bacterium]